MASVLMYILSVFHIWFGISTALKLGDANACEMNNSDGKPYITCCSGYIYWQKQNKCQDCPSGTYGVNCNSTCLPNYYGIRCKFPCNCTNTEKCSPITGHCEDISASVKGNTGSTNGDIALRNVAVGIVAVLVVIGLTALVLIRCNTVTCQLSVTGVFASMSRRHTFIQSRPAEIQVDDEDPYAEIRESKMIPLTGYGRQASLMTNAEVGNSGGQQSVEQEPSINEYGEPFENLLFVDNKE